MTSAIAAIAAPASDPDVRAREPLSVVVVDDDPIVRRGLQAQLGEGAEVVTACDGRGGLLAIRLRRPDVVLLDLEMPELVGEGVMRELSTDPDLAVIPVIVLTGSGEQELAAPMLELGAHDFVRKPRNGVRRSRSTATADLSGKVANSVLERARRSRSSGCSRFARASSSAFRCCSSIGS